MNTQANLTTNNCVIANYTEQRIPNYKGNKLIEALPPTMDDQQMLEALSLRPDFTDEQRTWPDQDRLMMLKSLQNFMVPLSSHLELCNALDSLLRAGYVGRAPRTAGHAAIAQKIYENQKQGLSFRQAASTRTPQLSTALLGLSGMGKTTTVNRWCAHIPQVIYHPDLNLHQITYLHTEMSSDGSSIKGLAHSILHQMDQLIPGANYFDQYAQRGKTGADSLMRSVARLMNMHLVGLLICDEVQNLAHARKGEQTVMTELVSAANELKVPLFLIGTNKAAKVLSLDFRQARRSTGHGIEPWDRLYPGSDLEPSEWDGLLDVLWSFQWLKNPVDIDRSFRSVMFECSQGVIDVAIKLFASSQARAILDGSETLTPALIADVYKKEFKLMHPMIDALREDNLENLARFDDIAPLNFSSMMDSMARKAISKHSPLYRVTSTDPTYKERLVTSVMALGFPADESVAAVAAQCAEGKVTNVIEGSQAVIKSLVKPKPTPRAKPDAKSMKAAPPSLPLDAFDACPSDYRRAIVHARHHETDVMTQLVGLDMAPSLDTLLNL
jgi:hypothetical protein